MVLASNPNPNPSPSPSPNPNPNPNQVVEAQMVPALEAALERLQVRV